MYPVKLFNASIPAGNFTEIRFCLFIQLCALIYYTSVRKFLQYNLKRADIFHKVDIYYTFRERKFSGGMIDIVACMIHFIAVNA